MAVWVGGCSAPAAGPEGETPPERAIARLDAFDIEEREDAQERLRAMGSSAVPAIRAALQRGVSRESRVRLEDVLPVAEADERLDLARARAGGVRIQAIRAGDLALLDVRAEIADAIATTQPPEIAVLAAWDDAGVRLRTLAPRNATIVLGGLSPSARSIGRILLTVSVSLPVSYADTSMSWDADSDVEIESFHLRCVSFSDTEISVRVERLDGEWPQVESLIDRIESAWVVDAGGAAHRVARVKAQVCPVTTFEEQAEKWSRQIYFQCPGLFAIRPGFLRFRWADRWIERSYAVERKGIPLMRPR